MRQRLKRLDNGTVIIEQGCVVESFHPVTEEIDLSGIAEEDMAQLLANPEAFVTQKNKDGNIVGLQKGKQRIPLSPPPPTPPAKTNELASKKR